MSTETEPDYTTADLQLNYRLIGAMASGDKAAALAVIAEAMMHDPANPAEGLARLAVALAETAGAIAATFGNDPVLFARAGLLELADDEANG